ncbi:MAG TPA: porin family protein [bacterium]|nr:porin family protein [bacterium]HPN43816.1 porin family protein [bacterium]
MKKCLVKLVVLFFFTMVTVSQAGMPALGVKCGLAIANQEYNFPHLSKYGSTYLTGLAAGAFGEFFADKPISLVAELDYIQKGIKEEYTYIAASSQQGSGVLSDTYRFHYLSIPLFIKYTWRKPAVAPYILLGFRFDYLFSRPSDTDIHNKIYSDFKNYDFGGSFGLGGEYKMSSKYKVLLEGRYSPAASYAYKDDTLKVNNCMFEILAGVQF